MVQQSAHRIGVPDRAGPDQRGGAVLVDVVGGGPALQQQPRDVGVPSDRGAEQRTGAVGVDLNPVNWSQHRIASPNPHPTSTGTK